jgi:hypothetical protein
MDVSNMMNKSISAPDVAAAAVCPSCNKESIKSKRMWEQVAIYRPY